MDTRQLRHFLAVYQHRSIGQAANALRLTQPALSKSLCRLERDLDVKLFERTPLGVVPTVFGESLALNARTITAELQQAERALAELRGGGRGRVTVGIGPSMAHNLLPEVTIHLAEVYPDVRLAVVEGLVDELLPMLRRGEIDVAIGSWPRTLDGDLAAETLFTDTIRVLAAANHPLARRKAELTDLLDYPWVLPPGNQRWRQRMNESFLTWSMAPPEPCMVANCATYIRALLLRGQFLTFLPMQVVAGAGGDVLALDCDLQMETDVTFTTRARTRKSPALQSFLSVLWDVTRPLAAAA